jgi:RNA polymerase sigma-70 factor (ECF subfamily)
MGSEDAELIGRWQRGDAQAFEALVRRWEGPIARFLARLAGPQEAVADLCQEVFLRAYHAGPRYRPTGAFSTWLYRIALNVARDAARRRRRRPAILESALEVPDRGLPAEAACQQKELARLMAQVLDELPEPLRLVLVLRHYEGMNFEEIGRLTGTPASTLKSRFAVALGRLRVRLEQLGWGPEESER